MKTFKNLNEFWLGAINDVREFGENVGSRDGASRELLNWNACLSNPRKNVVTAPARKWSPSYAAAEMLWYLSGEQHIGRVLAYAPQYARFSENNLAHGAYGWRISNTEAFGKELFDLVHAGKLNLDQNTFFTPKYQTPITQLQALCWLLKKKPETRQAVISLWNAGDLPHAIAGDKADLPCTLTMQFFVRDAKLSLKVNMRSNDIWLGTPYDVFCFTTVQALVAEALNLELGMYYHDVGSLHFYDRDVAKIDAAFIEQHRSYPDVVPYHPSVRVGEKLTDAIERTCKAEADMRFRKQAPNDLRPTLLDDLLVACGLKWGLTTPAHLHNAALRATANNPRTK